MKIKKVFNTFTASILSVSSLFVLAPTAAALPDTCTWSGGGGNLLASNGANWTGCDNSGVPEDGDSLVLPAADVPAQVNYLDQIILFNTNLDIAGITVSGTYPSGNSYPMYALGGTGSLTLSGAVSNTTDRALTITNNVILGSSITVTGSINIGDYESPGTLSLGANNLTLNKNISASSYATINSATSGSGNIIAGDGASLSLTGNNTFTGNITTTSNSALYAFTENALGAVNGNTVIANTVALVVGNCADTDGFNVAEDITLTGTAPEFFSKLSLGGFCAGAGAGGEPDSYGTYSTSEEMFELTGSITLNNDITVDGPAKKATISGTLNGTGKFVRNPQWGGELVISASSNTSGSANGTYLPSAIDPVTLSDDDATTSVNILNGATVTINGKRGSVFVTEGGVLKGTGTINGLFSYKGKVAVGNSPGVMNSTGNVAFSGGGTFEVEIGGTGAGEYDQLNVNPGTIDLGGSQPNTTAVSLNVVQWNNFRPAVNNTFTIINNDGTDAVVGTFQGIAEGAKVSFNGVEYSVTYKGGDGNDVVLTVTSAPAVPNTGIQLLTNNLLATTIMTLIAVVGIAYAARRQFSQK